MENYNTISTEKQQKYQYQYQISYSPLWKAFEKQRKSIEEQGKKQIEALEVLKQEENKKGSKQIDGYFPKDLRN